MGMMGDDFRTRRNTLPPREDLVERVAVLEQQDAHIRELMDKLDGQIIGLSGQLKNLGENVLLLAERVAEAAKTRDRWKNWYGGIASAIAVSLIIFLATMAWRVQAARVLPGP